MSRASSPEKLTLRDLKGKFHLQTSGDPNFFLEWQQNLPVISEWEHQRLDRIHAIYENFNEDSVLEEKLKITIVSPLLDLADFFLPPFQFSAEEQVQISVKDDKKTYRGKIDFLVLQDLVFLKMMLLDGIPVYAKSDEFLLEKKNDRACVLQILKQIGRSIQV